jgi:hypothetical protein
MDITFGVGFDRKNSFVGFDFHHFLAKVDFGPIFDHPFDQGDFLDRLSQLGDEKLFSHQLTTFRHAARIRPSLGMAPSSRISARGTGTLAEATRTIGASR